MSKYQTVVREVMQTLAGRVPVNKPEVKKHLIVNKDETEFILVSLGYHKSIYHYNIVAHVEIKGNKILIHEEGIDPSMFERLTERGVSEQDIFPAYVAGHSWAGEAVAA